MKSYEETIRDCEQEAEEIKKTIDKYKAKLKNSRNREELNAKINSYELIYYDLIGRANYLKKIAERRKK